jgi:uncharacterized membrane protein
MTFLLALLIGFIAGLRSLTAPAIVSVAAHLNWIHLENTKLSWLGSSVTMYILILLALVELVMDKLPTTPSRTSAVPLTARIVLGALSGAAICAAGGASIIAGAILGIVGALAGAFAGYQVRHKLTADLKLPDIVVALAEDAVAIGGALLIVSRL